VCVYESENESEKSDGITERIAKKIFFARVKNDISNKIFIIADRNDGDLLYNELFIRAFLRYIDIVVIGVSEAIPRDVLF